MESDYVSILNMDSEFLHITSAEYISGYLLKLTFSNGDVRMFDFSRIYNKGIFVKLQNPEYLRNFPLDGWTVDWNNEIGFAPEYLHEQGLPLALACNGMEKKCNW